MTESGVLDRARTSLGAMFVPVIFANGEDDDTPGLVALFANEAVQYEETIYAPDQDVTIRFKRMVMTARIFVLGTWDLPPSFYIAGVDILIHQQPHWRRHVTIDRCGIDLRLGGAPG